MQMDKGIVYALISAALFGASTPLAKLLLAQGPVLTLAGLLYAGSGIGLGAILLLRSAPRSSAERVASLDRRDLPWLAGAILMGGILGPVLLLAGLSGTSGSTASLLLNLEGMLTALLAWLVFREPFGRRIAIGMALIVMASIMLSWPDSQQEKIGGSAWNALLIIAACLCWAIDNNLTRKVSGGDALQIAALKGMAAGVVNLGLAGLMDLPLPELSGMLAAGIVGFFGYGISLVLFVLALRHLGAARTSAYFSAAPFIGAALSLLILRETPSFLFWPAVLLMAIGIWLHLTERHAHQHTHEEQTHAHAHVHDEHHRHAHDFQWDGKEPHSHVHRHEPLRHSHPHYPDIHHRHRH